MEPMTNRSDKGYEGGLAVSDADKGQELRALRFRDCDGAIEWDRPIEQCRDAAKRTFGVDDTGTLATRLITQVAKVMSPLLGERPAAADANDAAQLLEGIAPQDAVEGMLAVQMVATHNVAMRCLEAASLPNQTIQGIEANINRATKLMRTYTAQIEALNRHRSKARQTVIVKHVHVHEGGQAIVGNVAQGDGESGRE